MNCDFCLLAKHTSILPHLENREYIFVLFDMQEREKTVHPQRIKRRMTYNNIQRILQLDPKRK